MNTQRTSASPRLHAIAVVAHRYVGLALAVFLWVASLTGTLLVFDHELDAALNPRLMQVTPPASGTRPLDPLVLRDALLAQLPEHAQVAWLPLHHPAGGALEVWVTHAPESDDADDQYFVDPYTGSVLGSRRWGDLGQGLVNLMPFMYRLHYSLALGDVGTALFGAVALLWTLDCFVGAYLTLPPRRAGRSQRSVPRWLRRWKLAWLVRGTRLFSVVFTWHRASGLWLWAMLLVFAWSGVALNLPKVYRPITAALLGMAPSAEDTLPVLKPSRSAPRLDYHAARVRGADLLDHAARAQSFHVLEPYILGYDAEHGAYFYGVRSSLDVSRYPNTGVWLDGNSGAQLALERPTGHALGNTATAWLYALHFGAVRAWGLPYRVCVSVMGLAVFALSFSGVWIWWRKRARRAHQANPALSTFAPGAPTPGHR
jgi:uncharacterized iron-regulated membrane protein